MVLNRRHEVVAAFAGELFAMHRAATEVAREVAMQEVPHRFDVVVTSNAGFPLDQNLYQAVKGMSAAAKVVREGGLIVVAAECRDGFPDHGEFRQLLASASSPRELLASLSQRSHTVPDQWEAQILARVLSGARVAVHTDGLDADDLESAFLSPADDISRDGGRRAAAARRPPHLLRTTGRSRDHRLRPRLKLARRSVRDQRRLSGISGPGCCWPKHGSYMT